MALFQKTNTQHQTHRQGLTSMFVTLKKLASYEACIK